MAEKLMHILTRHKKRLTFEHIGFDTYKFRKVLYNFQNKIRRSWTYDHEKKVRQLQEIDASLRTFHLKDVRRSMKAKYKVFTEINDVLDDLQRHALYKDAADVESLIQNLIDRLDKILFSFQYKSDNEYLKKQKYESNDEREKELIAFRELTSADQYTFNVLSSKCNEQKQIGSLLRLVANKKIIMEDGIRLEVGYEDRLKTFFVDTNSSVKVFDDHVIVYGPDWASVYLTINELMDVQHCAMFIWDTMTFAGFKRFFDLNNTVIKQFCIEFDTESG